MRLLLLCVIAVPVLANPPGSIEEADALRLKKDWPAAAKAFEAIVKREPSNGLAWYRLGQSLQSLNQVRPAVDAFQHAIDNNFQPPVSMIWIAKTYAAGNEKEQAIAWLDRGAKAGFAIPQMMVGDKDFENLKSEPAYAAIADRIDRNGKPCLTTPEHRQFDFWIGEWEVEVGGQPVAHSSIQNINDGCVIYENWMPYKGGGGKSFNAYNAGKGKWQQFWVSGNGSVLELAGNLKDGVMRYDGVTRDQAGSETIERLTFTPLSRDRVRQFWDQSADGGKTWTVAFDGTYVRNQVKK